MTRDPPASASYHTLPVRLTTVGMKYKCRTQLNVEFCLVILLNMLTFFVFFFKCALAFSR